MDLNRPVDSIKQLQYPLLKNVRTYQIGRLEPRPGLTLIGSVTGPVHSIRRLNNPRTADWTRIIGSGTVLSFGQASFTQISTGFSGNPLALVPYRPTQSPDPWMYVMDSNKQVKVDVDGNLNSVGLPPPTNYPTVTRAATHFKAILDADTNTTGWTAGPSFVGGIVGNVTNVSTTIAAIKYDSGATGWAVIQPTAFTGISEGRIVKITAEQTVVVSASEGSASSTTISSIAATPSDATLFAIVLAAAPLELAANGLIENTTIGETVRIIAVVDGPADVKTILCKPAGAWAAGNTVFIRPSFRCYLAGTFAAGASITNTGIESGVNITEDYSLPFTGYTTSPIFAPLDLSKITSTIAATKDSYISLRLTLTRPNDLTSLRVLLGCKNTAVHADMFTTDYFYKDFTPADVTETGILNVKIAEWVPVGSPNWETIYHFELQATIRPPNNAEERGSVTNIYSHMLIDSMYLAGEPGPDMGKLGQPYIYRYRARVNSTGAVSNWSPPTWEAFDLRGETPSIAVPAQYTLATEADYIDFQRRGGTIPDKWYYVGSVLNSAVPVSFVDKYTDDVIIANPSEDQLHYQLWPTIGAQVTGTTVKVTGVVVTSAAAFSTSWAPLTPIEIAGVFYTIRAVYSTSALELYESAAAAGAVTFRVPEPILQAQPLPCFWGPIGNTLFACGDPTNPQRLYWTSLGSADDTTIANWTDITSPSEPLMNGVIYNGRSYVWSSERFFQILPDKNDELGNPISWTYVEVPNGKGLFGRWSFTGVQTPPGFILYWLGREGIYKTDGGAPVSITDEDMRPLFPNEGNLGVTVNGIAPPNVIAAQAANHRLAYIDDYLYYDYVDTTP
jgi:hypothetical protein